VAGIRGALAQTVPEHPKKENVFAISTFVGDVFLFQARAQIKSIKYDFNTSCNLAQNE